jgi:hypothetical protein
MGVPMASDTPSIKPTTKYGQTSEENALSSVPLNDNIEEDKELHAFSPDLVSRDV